MIAKNYSTDKVDISKGYALFVGSELIVLKDLVFNGAGEIDSVSIQWVMDALAQMVAGASKSMLPEHANDVINFDECMIGRVPSSDKQIELTENLENAAKELARYFDELRNGK